MYISKDDVLINPFVHDRPALARDAPKAAQRFRDLATRLDFILPAVSGRPAEPFGLNRRRENQPWSECIYERGSSSQVSSGLAQSTRPQALTSVCA